MEHDVHRIHILELNYEWDSLIVHCQATIHGSNRHNGSNLRIIEDEWERKEPKLIRLLSKDELWEQFKAYTIN